MSTEHRDTIKLFKQKGFQITPELQAKADEEERIEKKIAKFVAEAEAQREAERKAREQAEDEKDARFRAEAEMKVESLLAGEKESLLKAYKAGGGKAEDFERNVWPEMKRDILMKRALSEQEEARRQYAAHLRATL